MELSYIGSCFILTFLILQADTKRNFMIKISDIQCRSQSHIVNITCTETKSNRVAGLNMFVRLNEDVYNMRYNLDVLYLNKKNQWESFFKFTNLDVCEFLSAKFTVPVLLIARNLMRKFSNFPEHCPIKKDTFYYIQRMKFDPEQFPSYFPEGQFSATGVLFNDKHVFLDYTIGIQIVSKANRKVHLKDSNKVQLISKGY